MLVTARGEIPPVRCPVGRFLVTVIDCQTVSTSTACALISFWAENLHWLHFAVAKAMKTPRPPGAKAASQTNQDCLIESTSQWTLVLNQDKDPRSRFLRAWAKDAVTLTPPVDKKRSREDPFLTLGNWRAERCVDRSWWFQVEAPLRTSCPSSDSTTPCPIWTLSQVKHPTWFSRPVHLQTVACMMTSVPFPMGNSLVSRTPYLIPFLISINSRAISFACEDCVHVSILIFHVAEIKSYTKKLVHHFIMSFMSYLPVKGSPRSAFLMIGVCHFTCMTCLSKLKESVFYIDIQNCFMYICVNNNLIKCMIKLPR